MFNPVSTYRIQFHKGFNFKHFVQVIPYLAELGIKTIYASPIFKAAPGSIHGYDVTDPLTINPEIGTYRQLKNISAKLKKLGIGWLQDIVPNHMAFHPDNKWLMDVLQNGRQSAYSSFFDIIWDVPGQNGQLMVPFLGGSFEKAVNDGEIKISYKKGLYFTYSTQKYPLNKKSYSLLGLTVDEVPGKGILKNINADPKLLKHVAAVQHYRLCSWEETNSHINYRRFFTVNGLICLNMQNKVVFEKYHQFIGQLVKDDIFQGVRVDHIDGLYDPQTYLIRLRQLCGYDAYIITEKILEVGESFPADWPVQGNTGYDTLSVLNNLFTNKKSKKTLSAFYETLHTGKTPVNKHIFEKKRLILHNYMPGELENLNRLFAQSGPDAKQRQTPGLKDVIAELMVLFPVYRLYSNTFPLSKEDEKVIRNLLRQIRETKPDLINAVDVFGDILLNNSPTDKRYNHRILKFYQRLMQFTGPLMAKGVEDTLMYTHNRFIEHNEVGDSPDAFGLKPKEFHRHMSVRKMEWPLSMIATSTHDTKRGEDVRSRLNVLSDITSEWIENVRRWKHENEEHKTNNYPDANDEYFIYQTIAGAFPMPGQQTDDFDNRINEYLTKALREGKVNSDWAHPNEEYEEAAKKFAKGATDRIISSPIFTKLADHGIVNSLAQVLLKYTIPGIPDLYQGCEFWDLSLVDPDNRRPVDYEKRKQTLGSKNIDWNELWNNRYNGVIKQELTRLLLNSRNLNPELFTGGDYIRLKIKGRYKNNVFAFARRYEKNWFISAIPLHLASISGEGIQVPEAGWDDTKIQIPENAPRHWQNIFDGEKGYAEKYIPVKSIFVKLPVALLTLNDNNSRRSAGTLMHVTSLPSEYGAGDLGPSAFQFADFLFESGQKYWQLLPLNPVDATLEFSPYSNTSAMAGNTMLISPEILAKKGWLTKENLSAYKITQTDKADFEQAEINKRALFNVAYINFIKIDNNKLKNDFEKFKIGESYWLDDFALYEVLKAKYNGRPWYEWPKPYKLRESPALQAVRLEQQKSLDKVKWLQWVFMRQWEAIKLYCNSKNIAIMGDMPFYVSYNSVDVWTNTQLFKLDSNKRIIGKAGVPPDYFSADGQLWGMPVYDWSKHKIQGYQWWLRRIKRNLTFYDTIRLDHFRAFSEFWEVPSGSETATNGKWQPGPGNDFFNAIKDEIGELPFIAEDLGEISKDVYRLRDEFKLPGMRVLQFAFDDTMAVSPHIPHNYIQNCVAYTGTHDNNTIVGWFYDSMDQQMRKRLINYLGNKINGKNLNWEMIKLVYSSVADIVIVPMQDILGLGSQAKMNTPSSVNGNWRWRITTDYWAKGLSLKLKKWVYTYNR
jgi:malto-oligosyltrehalose synthase/4-alpha-glucanotransferase